MKFRSIYLLAALPLLVGAAMPFAIAGPSRSGVQLAQAEEKIERREQFREERRQRMIEELNLTDEQVQQLDAIRSDRKDAAKSNYEALKTERETLRNLVSNSASVNELRSQHQKIQDLRQSMGSERFENMLQMYEILTPEQRTTFAEKMKMRGGRRGRFGRHHHRRGKQADELQSMLTF